MDIISEVVDLDGRSVFFRCLFDMRLLLAAVAGDYGHVASTSDGLLYARVGQTGNRSVSLLKRVDVGIGDLSTHVRDGLLFVSFLREQDHF